MLLMLTLSDVLSQRYQFLDSGYANESCYLSKNYSSLSS